MVVGQALGARKAAAILGESAGQLLVPELKAEAVRRLEQAGEILVQRSGEPLQRLVREARALEGSVRPVEQVQALVGRTWRKVSKTARQRAMTQAGKQMAGAVMRAGLIGGAIDGGLAAVDGLRRYHRGEASGEAVVTHVARESARGGVSAAAATAAGVAAVTLLGAPVMATVGATLIAGAVVSHLFDCVVPRVFEDSE